MLLNQNSITLSAITTPTFRREEDVDKVYSCGFLFRDHGKGVEVALIRKNRPKWQAGLLNGIGGAIEDGESAAQAMTREFLEETGLIVNDWRCFAVLRHLRRGIYMFMSWQEVGAMQQLTDEQVGWWSVKVPRSEATIKNLRWLIPMALSGSKEVALIGDDFAHPGDQ